MKSDYTAGLDRNGFAGAGLAAGTRRLGADLEIAKTGNFYIVAIDQAVRDQVKKRVDHVFRFALVEPDLLKQQFGEVRLGQCRGLQAFYRKIHAAVLLAFLFWKVRVSLRHASAPRVDPADSRE